jgi:hypothetical protein
MQAAAPTAPAAAARRRSAAVASTAPAAGRRRRAAAAPTTPAAAAADGAAAIALEEYEAEYEALLDAVFLQGRSAVQYQVDHTLDAALVIIVGTYTPHLCTNFVEPDDPTSVSVRTVFDGHPFVWADILGFKPTASNETAVNSNALLAAFRRRSLGAKHSMRDLWGRLMTLFRAHPGPSIPVVGWGGQINKLLHLWAMGEGMFKVTRHLFNFEGIEINLCKTLGEHEFQFYETANLVHPSYPLHFPVVCPLFKRQYNCVASLA